MMKTIAVGITAGFLLLGAGIVPPCRAANPGTPLPLTAEVISILKSNYVDRDKLDEKSLNEATVAGILGAVGWGVVVGEPKTLSTNATPAVTNAPETTQPLVRAEVIGPDIGY